MSELATLARPYAAAVFKRAKETGTTEKWSQQLALLSLVLKDQSVQMRLERFLRAEKAGARASQAILIPLMIFIMPAVFIMVFGPVVISFMYGGK